MLFDFKTNLYGINKVEMIICDENWDEQLILMNYNNNSWFRELNTNNKRVVYRYRINDGIISMNDPDADYYIKDSSMVVWSVREFKDCKDEKKANLNIKEYIITDRVMNSISKYYSKKQFVNNDIAKIAIGTKVENIKGIHSISVIWYQPDGRIYRLDERTIESEENVIAEVWFWMNTNDMKGDFYKGIWTLEVFLDGRSVIKDNFIVNDRRKEQYIGFSCIA